MAAVEWSYDVFVPVSPDDAWRWMTDFREDDHSRPAYKRAAGVRDGKGAPSKRTVLSREGSVLRIQDSWGRKTFTSKVTLHSAERAITIEGEWGYRSRWWVETQPGGIRLRTAGSVAPGGFFGLLMPLFRKGMLREQERDFRGHVADLLNELNPEGTPVEPR